MKIKDIKLFYRDFKLLNECESIGPETDVIAGIEILKTTYSELENEKIDILKCISLLETIKNQEKLQNRKR